MKGTLGTHGAIGVAASVIMDGYLWELAAGLLGQWLGVRKMGCLGQYKGHLESSEVMASSLRTSLVLASGERGLGIGVPGTWGECFIASVGFLDSRNLVPEKGNWFWTK